MIRLSIDYVTKHSKWNLWLAVLPVCFHAFCCKKTNTMEYYHKNPNTHEYRGHSAVGVATTIRLVSMGLTIVNAKDCHFFVADGFKNYTNLAVNVLMHACWTKEHSSRVKFTQTRTYTIHAGDSLAPAATNPRQFWKIKNLSISHAAQAITTFVTVTRARVVSIAFQKIWAMWLVSWCSLARQLTDMCNFGAFWLVSCHGRWFLKHVAHMPGANLSSLLRLLSNLTYLLQNLRGVERLREKFPGKQLPEQWCNFYSEVLKAGPSLMFLS